MAATFLKQLRQGGEKTKIAMPKQHQRSRVTIEIHLHQVGKLGKKSSQGRLSSAKVMQEKRLTSIKD